MKKPASILIFLYGCLSMANLAAIVAQSQTGMYFTKPLLMAALSGWFYLETKKHRSAFSLLILIGLMFSIGGDTLLMFVKPETAYFFLLGLASFLVTHLLYITAFSKYPDAKGGIVWKKRWLIAPFLIYLAGFSLFIWKGLPDDFKIPVVVYASVITLMAASCLNLNGRAGKLASRLLFTGAVLFVISDSIIALKKFKFPDAPDIPFSLAIMITYLAGQFLIAKGAVLSNKEIK